MNFNQDLNINYLKSQQTVGELRKVVKEAQSPIKLQLDTARGDKSFARMQSKTAQARSNGFSHTSFQKNLFLAESHDRPLKRTTLNYSKLREEQWQKNKSQALNELGIIQL